MISITERYLGAMIPLAKPNTFTNKPLHKGSMGDASGEYKRRRFLDQQRIKRNLDFKKNLFSQQTNPMQNI